MQYGEKRVVIGVPSGDMIHTGFTSSLVNMLMHTMSCDIANSLNCTVQFYGSSVLPYSRQILAQYTLDLKFTHLLFIDSDMKFPHWMLAKFLERTEAIIGINALSRRAPYRCTAQEAPGVQLSTKPESTGLEKVFRTGFGVMWVAAEVFARMPEPWFDFEFQPEYKVFKGEDYVFCEKAKQLGYEIWIDHDISKEVEHLGEMGYTPQMRELLEPTPAERKLRLA